MTIYYLPIYSLSLSIIYIILLATSYSPEQSVMLNKGIVSDKSIDKLINTHTRYQNIIYTMVTLSFLFTVVYGCIVVVMFVKG